MLFYDSDQTYSRTEYSILIQKILLWIPVQSIGLPYNLFDTMKSSVLDNSEKKTLKKKKVW